MVPFRLYAATGNVVARLHSVNAISMQTTSSSGTNTSLARGTL